VFDDFFESVKERKKRPSLDEIEVEVNIKPHRNGIGGGKTQTVTGGAVTTGISPPTKRKLSKSKPVNAPPPIQNPPTPDPNSGCDGEECGTKDCDAGCAAAFNYPQH